MQQFHAFQVLPGKEHKLAIGEGMGFHLSVVSVPYKMSGHTTLYVSVDGKSYAIGTLDTKFHVLQMTTDLVFNFAQNVTFHAKGATAVHCIGYVQEVDDELDAPFGGEDDEENSEDAADELAGAKLPIEDGPDSDKAEESEESDSLVNEEMEADEAEEEEEEEDDDEEDDEEEEKSTEEAADPTAPSSDDDAEEEEEDGDEEIDDDEEVELDSDNEEEEGEGEGEDSDDDDEDDEEDEDEEEEDEEEQQPVRKSARVEVNGQSSPQKTSSPQKGSPQQSPRKSQGASSPLKSGQSPQQQQQRHSQGGPSPRKSFGSPQSGGRPSQGRKSA